MESSFESTFRVVLLPDLPPGIDREKALDGLAGRFGIDREKAGAFLDEAPRIIKKGLNRQQAHQYQKTITACGLDCLIEPEAEPEPAPPPKTAPSVSEISAVSDLPCCPSCGYQAQNKDDPLITAFDGMGQCPSCEIIVAKFTRTGKDGEPAEAGEDSVPDADSGFSPGSRQPPALPVFTADPSRNSGLGKRVGVAVGCLFVVLVGYLFFRDSGTTDQKPGATRQTEL